MICSGGFHREETLPGEGERYGGSQTDDVEKKQPILISFGDLPESPPDSNLTAKVYYSRYGAETTGKR